MIMLNKNLKDIQNSTSPPHTMFILYIYVTIANFVNQNVITFSNSWSDVFVLEFLSISYRQ